MTPSTPILVQAAGVSAKELNSLIADAGGSAGAVAEQNDRFAAAPGGGDAVAVVDEATYTALAGAKSVTLERVEWLGSMADPEGVPKDQSLYPGHVPLTERQVESLRKEDAKLYRVGGISDEDLKAVVARLEGGGSLELVKMAGRLHDGARREMTVKANDQGILGLLAKVGAQVSIC
ncbi:hypothetical protein [Azospirillum sp. ST 5-10]|uniref:hypothetical protein n=1 Tax=unclassified Azospirillum TaxID=2630922 RepID=UPI003F49D4AE